jgi:hypothetical protein
MRILVGAALLAASSAESNGLARLPQMGWDSWNWIGARTDCSNEPYRCMDDANIRAMAAALVSSGMFDAGYRTVHVSESWPAATRAANGSIVADPVRFPYGLADLIAHVHGMGMKFGTYLDVGTNTCAGFPGSFGHEEQDVATIAGWGADYLWLDGCNWPGNTSAFLDVYHLWGTLLNNSGRDIVWEASLPAYTAVDFNFVSSFSHEWRFYEDIRPDWNEIMQIVDYAVDNNILSYLKPGQYPLLDMMEVGNDGLSTAESRAHFSLWCMFAQPLYAGNDVRNMTDEIVAILTNKEVIAIDQDPLVRAGSLVARVNASNAHRFSRRVNTVVLDAALHAAEDASASCPVWNVTVNGYNETCQGPAGNIDCFNSTTLGEVNATCCADAQCAGFSYNPATESGCTKRDMDCGFTPDPGYFGYSKPGFQPPPQGDVYARLLSDASVAVLVVNRGAAPAEFCINFGDVGLNPFEYAQVRDLWAHADVGPVLGQYCATVDSHDVAMVRVYQ